MTASQVLQRSDALYRAGLSAELLDGLGRLDCPAADLETTLRLKIVEGMAAFDLGRVVSALEQLRQAVELSKQAPAPLRFTAALALFVRETDFQSPGDVLPGLSTLRQLASSIGEATPLAGLHLGVARLEGLRGQCLAARRHLEIARRFSERCDDDGLKCCVDNVDASLEAIAGNLAGSRALAQACVDRARRAQLARYEIGAIANIAAVELYTGSARPGATAARADPRSDRAASPTSRLAPSTASPRSSSAKATWPSAAISSRAARPSPPPISCRPRPGTRSRTRSRAARTSSGRDRGPRSSMS